LITGTSATQAHGAILGLSQALASGVVRAEEYNQINEGGLRPLLQAAAASEKFGGDVNRLRAAMLDGKVTSEQFFSAILDGSQQLEGRASKAALTLSGAFEALTSQLTVYFGEAGKGSGATEALASAIQKLGDNLDTLIPILATIAVGLGVGYVTNAVRAQLATVALGTAATATGRALLAAFGGPVGLAITAVTVALVAFGSAAENAAQKTDRLRSSADQAISTAATYRQRLVDAGVAVEGVGKFADVAGGKIGGLAGEMQNASREALNLVNNLNKLGVTKAVGRLNEISNERRQIARNLGVSKGLTAANPGAGDLFNRFFGVGNTAGQLSSLNSEEAALKEQLRLIALAQKNGVDLAGGGGSSPVATDPNKKTPKSTRTTGPSVVETAERQEQELARLRQEEIQAKIALVDNADERAALERDLLAEEFAARRAQIQADEDLNAQQKAAQIDILESLYGVQKASADGQAIIVQANKSLYAQAIERERLAQIEREEADLAAERFQSEADALRLQYDLADTQDQRRAIALSILDAEDRYLKSKLEAVLASEVATEAEKERARIALEAVNATSADRRAAVNRSEAGPLDRYAQYLSDPKQRVEEAVVRQLERVNEGISDAISKAIGVDDPFISELLDILLQEILFKPLAESLSGGASSGASGLFSAIGSIFGGARAAGGSVSPGQAYLVGERGRELFMPDQPGTIIPNSRLSSSERSNGSGVVRLIIEEAPGFAARVRTEAAGVAVEVVEYLGPDMVSTASQRARRDAARPITPGGATG
jgi:tape measure domain-containing protein